MTAQPLGDLVTYDVPLLKKDEPVGAAVREIVASGLPALPVVDNGAWLRGIFGEREFIGAIFPGYLSEMRSLSFLTEATDELIDSRAECRYDPVSKYMTTEHVEVAPGYSVAHLAEIFLHHRVLIVPVVNHGEVGGVVTRARFFAALVERMTGPA
jgi:CBS domain-containing protein